MLELFLPEVERDLPIKLHIAGSCRGSCQQSRDVRPGLDELLRQPEIGGVCIGSVLAQRGTFRCRNLRASLGNLTFEILERAIVRIVMRHHIVVLQLQSGQRALKNPQYLTVVGSPLLGAQSCWGHLQLHFKVVNPALSFGDPGLSPPQRRVELIQLLQYQVTLHYWEGNFLLAAKTGQACLCLLETLPILL